MPGAFYCSRKCNLTVAIINIRDTAGYVKHSRRQNYRVRSTNWRQIQTRKRSEPNSDLTCGLLQYSLIPSTNPFQKSIQDLLSRDKMQWLHRNYSKYQLKSDADNAMSSRARAEWAGIVAVFCVILCNEKKNVLRRGILILFSDRDTTEL